MNERQTGLAKQSREELEVIICELLVKQREVLRGLSHDLRNPLQIIMLQAERLQKIAVGPAAREQRIAEAILAAARQLRDIVQGLAERGQSGMIRGG